jgi:hypothetical protein
VGTFNYSLNLGGTVLVAYKRHTEENNRENCNLSDATDVRRDIPYWPP